MPKRAAPRPLRRPIPWRLVVVLAVYAAASTGLAWFQFWSTAEYQAAVHYDRAIALLGQNRGRTVAPEQLLEGYREMLEAARLVPHVRMLHDELEQLSWIAQDRKVALPADLRRKTDALTLVWKRIQVNEAPLLAQDRLWAPHRLLSGPPAIAGWSLLGALVIVATWAAVRFRQRLMKVWRGLGVPTEPQPKPESAPSPAAVRRRKPSPSKRKA